MILLGAHNGTCPVHLRLEEYFMRNKMEARKVLTTPHYNKALNKISREDPEMNFRDNLLEV